MARRIDRDGSPSIRRTCNGVIDIRYHEWRARKLRDRWMRVWLGRFIAHVTRLWRCRAVKAKLDTLDERTLHDIGIVYGDIPTIASGSYFHDESRKQRGTWIPSATAEHEPSPLVAIDAHIPAKGEVAMVSPLSQQPHEFAQKWIEAWNRRDLDAVLAHFSDDFEFSSPFISQVAGEPTGRLIGKEAVRTYWQKALSRLPDLHFELVHVLTGVNCITILYRGHRGLSAEVLQFGPDDRAMRGQALYMAGT